MSREAFTPTQQNAGSSQGAGGNAISFEVTDCDAKVSLKKGDPIRCKECGYRILYKERTNRMIQFEAR